MLSLIHKIPIVTTLFSVYFFIVILQHYLKKRNSTYLLWWTIGVFCYGLGTLTESYVGLFGWNAWVFKSWYITGALLGGFPLAQGTAHLLLNNKTATTLSVVFSIAIITASVFVALSPLNYELVEPTRLSGKVLQWKQIRLVTPFINIYAFIMLVGGAIYSAWLYQKQGTEFHSRYKGNILIAIGGLLPGIGGSFTKFGYVEVLYITELIGILFIYWGYVVMKSDKKISVHAMQQLS